MKKKILCYVMPLLLLSSCELVDFFNKDSGESTSITILDQYTQMDIEPEATSQDITFTATESWVISLEETKATPSWITVSPMSGDEGEITIVLTLEPNPSVESRTAIITINSYNGDECEITVVQAGAEDGIEDHEEEEQDAELSEYEILMELYEATEGDNWTNNTNWGSDSPFSDWYGIIIENDAITQLNLKYNNLSGEIPASIGHMQDLTCLNLSYNELSGEIPESIGNLTNLTDLNLFTNQLSGEIPDTLGNLIKLTNLNLSTNQLSGEIPESLGSLINLTGLYLFYNNLTGVIPQSVASLEENCYFFIIMPQYDDYSLFEGIYTLEEFLEFASEVRGGQSVRDNKMLMTDIDLINIDFEPMGNGNPYLYYGVFDGNNHTIRNLTISKSGEYYVGLFGILSPESEVRNINLSNISISGGGFTGGIAGNNYNGVIRNCTVESGYIVGSNQNVGGIVGCNYSGTVSECENNSYVESTSGGFIGGVVGLNQYGNIIECNNSGSVLGPTDYLGVGGIVGNNVDNGAVTACYNGGDVKGSECVGGVVGRNYSSVDICYNTGDVEATLLIAYVGGIIGSNNLGGVVTSCYNIGNAENVNPTDPDAAPRTVAGAVTGYNDGTFVACCYVYSSGLYPLGGLDSIAGSLDGTYSSLNYSLMNSALSSEIPYYYDLSGCIVKSE